MKYKVTIELNCNKLTCGKCRWCMKYPDKGFCMLFLESRAPAKGEDWTLLQNQKRCQACLDNVLIGDSSPRLEQKKP